MPGSDAGRRARPAVDRLRWPPRGGARAAALRDCHARGPIGRGARERDGHRPRHDGGKVTGRRLLVYPAGPHRSGAHRSESGGVCRHRSPDRHRDDGLGPAAAFRRGDVGGGFRSTF